MLFNQAKGRVAAFLIAASMVGGVAAAPANASSTSRGGDPYGRRDFQRDLDAIRDEAVTGVQARVDAPGGRRLVGASGVGDLETGRPVNPAGHFRMGSVNKTVVATVALQLVGEGRLSLDDSVDRWLPGLISGNGNDGRTITVEQLLQHTSGIVDDYPGMGSAAEYYERRFDFPTPEEVVARAMTHPPAFAPGAGWRYSNTGYVVVGMIVERITGRPWYVEVEERILEPLGMTRTSWPDDSATLPRPHARAYERFQPDEGVTDVTLIVDADASGGMITTTQDLSVFVRALFSGRLLAPAQLAQMQQTVPVSEEVDTLWPGARYGLGVFQRPLPCGGDYWQPAGDQAGWTTRTGVAGDGSTSAVLSLSGSTEVLDSWESIRGREAAVDSLVHDALCSGR